MSYAPYPAYKDSGVTWLGQVPEGWEVKRLSYATRFKGGSTPSKNEDQFWIDGTIPWVSPKDMKRKEIHDTEDHLTELGALQSASGLIDPGHVMMVVRSGILRHSIPAAINRVPVTVNQDMRVFLPFRELKSEFIYWVIEGLQKTLVDLWSKPGTTVESLETEYVNSSPFPVPSIEEQAAIADFLDKKTAEIDDLIAKKEELLRLLAEQRTALITHAVTKGLNPNAPMKPSGIDWLGDVPEGWEIRPISTAIQKLESGVSVNAMDVPAEDDQQGVLKTSAVYSGSFDPTQNKLIYDPVEAERLACPVRKGELIISRMNTPDLVGAVGIVEDEYPNLFLPDRLWQTRFWNQATANAPFLYYFLSSKLFRAVIASLASGTSGSMQNITQSDLMTIKIGMPPLSEQSQIVNFLDQALKKLDATRGKTDEAIEKLREYRTALITNAVTGKIKVA